jgi:NAD(P)-dependent dehydrogenase (short-subunit alcohol dehydrogenase family)
VNRQSLALHGKVALVTGGASGIGRAIVSIFAAQGAAVVVMDRDRDGGAMVVEELAGRDCPAAFAHGDVSRASDCERAVQEAVRTFGGLDLLLNNAGIIQRASVPELTEADWDLAMAVNVKSVFLMSHYAIPLMIERKGGVIINVASGWGLVGGRRAASYCASKGAVVQLTKAMALDHGGHNIRVNCICPGDTDTSMLRGEAAQLGEPVDQFLSDAAARPLGRVGTPEDIAQAALYLASDAAAFVTGASLVVDGGGLAGS